MNTPGGDFLHLVPTHTYISANLSLAFPRLEGFSHPVYIMLHMSVCTSHLLTVPYCESLRASAQHHAPFPRKHKTNLQHSSDMIYCFSRNGNVQHTILFKFWKWILFWKCIHLNTVSLRRTAFHREVFLRRFEHNVHHFQVNTPSWHGSDKCFSSEMKIKARRRMTAIKSCRTWGEILNPWTQSAGNFCLVFRFWLLTLKAFKWCIACKGHCKNTL